MKPIPVRAKFKVESITETKNWVAGQPNLKAIELVPVYSADKESENGKFFAATPNGKILLGTVNPDAAAIFEVGEEYFIDFTKASA